MNEILEAALKYAENNIAVIPVNPKTKAPYTNHGSHDASRRRDQILAWWEVHPDANVGIVTGSANAGLIVVDLDVDSNKGIDGVAELREWERKNGKLPETWRAITGRGGAHLYFMAPDEDTRNSAQFLGCIDIRGEGGYVVAPPSVHPNGNRYYWEDDPDDVDLAQADDTLRKLLAECRTESTALAVSSVGGSTRFVTQEKIKEGGRDLYIFRWICSHQERGDSDEAIIQGALAENRARCDPPLEDDYIVQKCHYVLKKYKKGKPILVDEEGVAHTGWHEPTITMSETGRVVQSISNFTEAIEFDKDLFGRIRYNELAYGAFVSGALPWDKSTIEREWTNFDDTECREYLEKKYGLKNKDNYATAFNNAINHHKYNPVRDYLEDMYLKWDKKDGHIAKLLPKYLDVEDTPYQAAAMRLMMLGAVCRIYRPGCKFDHAMIIVGDQGGGKSSFVRLLFQNNTWFTDNFNTIEGDKAAEKLRGMWGVEIAELLALKRAKEVESFKSFLTSTTDIYRAPYQRLTEARPRMCVFFGTTNDMQFMSDKTGNRRFLPIRARTTQHNAKLPSMQDEFSADVSQAWGEAVGIVKKALRNDRLPDLVLPPGILAEAELVRGAYIEEDPWEGIIANWLETERPTRVCASMIYEQAFERKAADLGKQETKRILQIMANMKGWKRYPSADGRAKCPPYSYSVCYVPIEEHVEFEELDDDLPVPFTV